MAEKEERNTKKEEKCSHDQAPLIKRGRMRVAWRWRCQEREGSFDAFQNAKTGT
jgi:hypothetical protein